MRYHPNVERAHHHEVLLSSCHSAGRALPWTLCNRFAHSAGPKTMEEGMLLIGWSVGAPFWRSGGLLDGSRGGLLEASWNPGNLLEAS